LALSYSIKASLELEIQQLEFDAEHNAASSTAFELCEERKLDDEIASLESDVRAAKASLMQAEYVKSQLLLRSIKT